MLTIIRLGLFYLLFIGSMILLSVFQMENLIVANACSIVKTAKELLTNLLMTQLQLVMMEKKARMNIQGFTEI